MKKIDVYLFFLVSVFVLCSCSPSVTSNLVNEENLSKYKYVLWPSNTTGDRELDYVMFEVYDALKATRLEVIPETQLFHYPPNETLIAHCHASQDRSKSVVTIDFKNGMTDLPVLYIQGSFGLGWDKKGDMKGAISGLKKKLIMYFPKDDYI